MTWNFPLRRVELVETCDDLLMAEVLTDSVGKKVVQAGGRV